MKKKNLFLTLITALFLTTSLSGCSPRGDTPGGSEVDPKDLPIQPLDHLLPVPNWATPTEELTSYTNDVSYHQNMFSDVETGYSFDIKMDDDSYSGQLGDYVRVYDSTRIQYSLKFTDIGGDQYRVSPTHPYEAGRYYTIELKDNAPFHLSGKDPSLKEFHFNVASFGDTEVYNVKSTVRRYLLDDVISKQEFTSNEEESLRVMLTKRPLNLKKDDHFLFWNGSQIDRHSFYGKFDHEVLDHGIYHVYYTYPELGEIFGEDGLDVSYHNYVPDQIYDLVMASENEIKENLTNSPELQDLIYEAYRSYEPEKEHMSNDAYDWIMAMKSIQIKPEFGFYWPGWSFSLSLRVTVPFDYASLTFYWQYYRQSTTTCDASIKLRECMDVPYWADIAVDISEVVDTTYRFCIIVGDDYPVPGKDDDDDDAMFKSLSEYAGDKAKDFNGAEKKYETIKQSGKDGVKFDGKTLTVKLGTGRFPIGWLFDIFVDFNFQLKLEATVMLSMSYTEHSESTLVSYRSGDEDKSSHSVSDLKSCSKTLMLIGQLGVDVGLYLRFGIGICGLEDYISFSINLNIGLYVSFGGYGMWTWTNSPTGNKFEGHGGLIFEVGWFAQVGVELNLFFVDIGCDFIAIRKPFYSTTNDQYFVAAPVIEGNTIHLETHKVVVNDLGLLTFDTFNVAYMKPTIQTFDPEVELDYTDDSGHDTHGKVFNFYFKSGKYIRYENGYFIINDDCPAQFTDTLYVDVPNSLYKLKDGESHFIEVTIDFYDENARPVYMDNELAGYYRYGDLMKIPGCPKDREDEGYRFYGWYCKETDSYYGEGEDFIIPLQKEKHQRLDLTSFYYPIIYHTVTFYDGLGNVIWTGQVEEGLDAVEPTAEARDALMPEGAVFVGWSTDFTNVFYDTEVYAIYFYVDGGNN